MIIVEHGDLGLEAPRDLARALRQQRFIRQLGVGAGEKENARRAKAVRDRQDRLGDSGRFGSLGYDDVIPEICQAFAQTYASGQTGPPGSARRPSSSIPRLAAGSPSGLLRRRGSRCRRSRAGRDSIADIVEAALFEGKIVFIRRTDADGAFDDMVIKRV